MKKSNLFEAFSPISTEDWKNQLIKDLKGSDYDKTLVTNTREGIKVQPFYRKENLKNTQLADQLPGDFPFLRGTKKNNDWKVRHDIMVETIPKANEKAKLIATQGVDSIGFLFSDQFQPSIEDIERLMEGINAEDIEINFLCSSSSHIVLSSYVELIKRYNRDVNKIFGSVDFDPFFIFSFRGKFCQSESYSFKHAKQMVHAAKDLPHFKVLAVHGYNLRNAGANAVQELAFSLAQGVEYLNKIIPQGLSAEKVAKRIKFNFGIGSNYFMEIAKLRAARYLWSKTLTAYSIEDMDLLKMNIHSVSSTWNKSIYDAHVNLLRTTTEGMSAVLGGTDSLVLSPYNMTYQKPSEFSERIAKNQQLLFKEESFLDKVVDPSAGSYYIESLTNSLVKEAWKLFLEVDKKGGYLESLRQGFIQSEIELVAQQSREAMATRREIVLGSNQYPNFEEHHEELVNPDIFEALDLSVPNAEIKTIKQSRLSQEIERIRHKTDLYAIANSRPKVFLFSIGNKGMRKMRAQFASNYFACAGFELEDNNGFEDVNLGIKVAMESKADIVVICSSDQEYPAFAEAINEKMGEHTILVIAGYPKDSLEEIKALGISHFIHAKSNIIEDLRKYQFELGVE